ncbi:MAG: class I SAM-dependent methyltransferase [Cohaesibacteraceae bacterium]|nr:class I SAM-dependent methyltransferase [Cohaesibacteraceae bacterium]
MSVLADPITKLPAYLNSFSLVEGVVDARVQLKHTFGYTDWKIGQDIFETWETDGVGYKGRVDEYKKEIENDRPIYDHFKITGDVLDVGGLAGTVREFLPQNTRYISMDPFIDAITKIPKSKIEAYKCLSEVFNFIGAVAEFIPFQAETFDWVHMRSMLDHVQVPDLAIKEACRVLKPNGSILIGLHVEGGKSGRKPPLILMKDFIKWVFELVGFDKYKDRHTWHPTYNKLLKLISDNGFTIADSYWQPHWKDQVVYVLAHKV